MLRLILLFVALLCSAAAASSGKIAGVVTAVASGDPVAEVNIELVGTGRSASSDAEGRFVLLNVPPGIYPSRPHTCATRRSLWRLCVLRPV